MDVTVAFHRPAARDELGDRQGEPEELGTVAGKLSPVSRRELVAEGADPDEQRDRLYVKGALGVPVRNHDVAVIGEDRYRVLGAPSAWGLGVVVDLGREAG